MKMHRPDWLDKADWDDQSGLDSLLAELLIISAS